jgi:hypothetical protein
VVPFEPFAALRRVFGAGPANTPPIAPNVPEADIVDSIFFITTRSLQCIHKLDRKTCHLYDYLRAASKKVVIISESVT